MAKQNKNHFLTGNKHFLQFWRAQWSSFYPEKSYFHTKLQIFLNNSLVCSAQYENIYFTYNSPARLPFLRLTQYECLLSFLLVCHDSSVALSWFCVMESSLVFTSAWTSVEFLGTIPSWKTANCVCNVTESKDFSNLRTMPPPMQSYLVCPPIFPTLLAIFCILLPDISKKFLRFIHGRASHLPDKSNWLCNAPVPSKDGCTYSINSI